MLPTFRWGCSGVRLVSAVSLLRGVVGGEVVVVVGLFASGSAVSVSVAVALAWTRGSVVSGVAFVVVVGVVEVGGFLVIWVLVAIAVEGWVAVVVVGVVFLGVVARIASFFYGGALVCWSWLLGRRTP